MWYKTPRHTFMELGKDSRHFVNFVLTSKNSLLWCYEQGNKVK